MSFPWLQRQAAAQWSHAGNPILLPLRLAARELRGGLRGFYVLIACIGLGVMAIAGIGSVASGLAGGLAHEGRVILGGDLSFSLSLREASTPEREFLEQRGLLSVAATMRAMARTTDGRVALVEIKAVDASYPLYGAATLDPPQALADALAPRDGAFGAAADPTLLARLDLAQGARVTVGSATIEIRANLQSEPDKLAGGLGFGPRLLVSEAALRATGLLRPGSVVRWHYRLRLPANDQTDAAVRATTVAARAQFPQAGWEIRSRANASPSLEQNVERFTQYLALVGLTALLIGGAGVANAVKAHIDRRWEVIATLKSLGATGSQVFAVYLLQIVALAALGAAPGLLIGAAAPFLVAWGLGAVLPLPIEPAVHLGDLALALLYGLLTAVAFAIWPLGRAHGVPPSALFRDEVSNEWRAPGARYLAASAVCAAALAALAVTLAYDRRIAMIFVAAAAGAFALLRLLAALLMRGARALPHPRSPVLRLALANIHRPGALTPSIVLSLGLGLTLLCTVIAIDSNLRRQFLAAIPEQAPSFFFIDIPAANAGTFDAFIAAQAPGGQRYWGREPAAAAGGGLGVAERPRHHLRSGFAGRLAPGRRPVVEQRLPGPAAGLFRKKNSRWARVEGRRYGDRQRARPQSHRDGRQSAHRGLAKPRHQFRHGILAEYVPRRSCRPYRDAHLYDREHRQGGDGAAQGCRTDIPRDCGHAGTRRA